MGGGGELSLLPALEPVLGISVALNLVYLNIQKFHYITIVKDKLGSRLRELDRRVINQVKNTQWYTQLRELADVDTIELEWPKLTKKIYIKAPGLWGFAYNFFFYWRFGKIISLAATCYALFLLFLGVGHTASATDFLQSYFNETIAWHYGLSVFSAIWPIVSVAAGEFVCVSAARFVKYQTDSLRSQATTKAVKAVRELQENLDA
jgi:hypothetical protein